MDFELMIRRIAQMTLGDWLRVQVMRFVVTLLLMMFVGVGDVWGQTDYSGVYYIGTVDNSNGYYLCPTEEWNYYQNSNPYYTNTADPDNVMPFMTTYKCKSTSGYDKRKAVWIIEKHPSSNYYYIKHALDDKYLTYNAAFLSNKGRVRVHLEDSPANDDYALFKIEYVSASSSYDIISKYAEDNNIDPDNNKPRKYLNINKGNKPSLQGTNADVQDGVNCGGIIGLWTAGSSEGQGTGRFFLEDYITRPTIEFNVSNQIVITALQPGATLIYTTDGSIPTAENGTKVNSTTFALNPEDGMTTIKAVAVVGGELSNVATFFTPVLFGSQHKYLIQSQNNPWNDADFHFYMIPGDENNSIMKVNTTSLFRPSMEWYFLNAGVEAGVQYYYIVNNANGKYLCYDSTNKIYMENFSSNDKFKFIIEESPTAGSFNIRPYGLSTGDRFVNKSNDNANNGVINLNSNNNINNTRWKFVLPSSLDKTAPFTVTSYYKINSVGSSGYYIVTPSGNNSNATTSNSSDASVVKTGVWYFEEAQAATSDDWLTYYHIRNAETGDYLYFTKVANNVGACLEMRRTIESGSEDRYLFTWAKTADANVNYYIIPKNLKDISQNQFSALQRNNNNLQTNLTRSAGNYAWTFQTSSFKCEAPALNYDPLTGQISITCNTPAATIYVAHYDSEPSSSNIPELIDANVYSGVFDALPGYYKAVAARITGGADMSDATTSDEIGEFKCLRPVISKTSGHVTITCATPGATIYYIVGSGEFSETAENYGGTLYTEGGFDTSETVIKAIAVKNSVWSTKSSEALYDKTPTPITSTDQITNMDGVYYINGSFSASGIIGSATDPFTGELDGRMVEFSLNQPLFGYVSGATIKNVIISSASVSTSGHAGAIANVANGDTRIYNCGINGGSVSGSSYVGGLVGLLDGSSRVINCYNNANITNGSYVGGIVGYNNHASTSSDIQTMVMNCMFYGDITSGNNKAPIYNGLIISNKDASGLSNYNYFRAEASYVENHNIDTYNCALMAETRFLQRFEFFRHVLNSNRELAAWYATGSTANKDLIMKWVMEPSQIGSDMPYPTLKEPGRYHSVVYIDDLDVTTGKSQSIGTGLGTLTVTVSMGSGGEQFSAPAGAAITSSSITLDITDKDPDHFNYNYGKVQLPYYNDVGTKNYTENRVVTGWKIVSISGGTPSTLTLTGSDVTFDEGNPSTMPYNYADRKCTNKDLYETSKRVFNQGAYWDVPDGVTAITIQPYWAKAAYVSDPYYDKVYNENMNTGYDVTTVGGGQRYVDNNTYSINGYNQKVYTSMSNALGSGALAPNTSHTVYDYAVVLVGNYHQYNAINNSLPYTVMSIDLDKDNEPDYSFMLRFDGRTAFHPVRYDFLNLIGLGMAQKSTGGTGSYNFGIMQPKDWFEATNTALFRVTQFEYSPANRVRKPIILQGGVIEQWVTQQQDAGDAVEYFLVGGNVWFKEFHRGSHQDNTGRSTPHPPVSVTGGDFESFYLTGLYQSKAAIYNDDAECYISGGNFGTVAGTGMEGIGFNNNNTGNIFWQIDHADIDEFYGGGINAVNPVQGNIYTIIRNSNVQQFCGGPKFGDMQSGRTVTTIADNCTFTTFFGAGYGGSSYNRYAPTNQNAIMNPTNPTWNTWISQQFEQEYSDDESKNGISTRFDYQFIPQSGNTNNVARLFVDFVSFSLATTHNVNSTLDGCTINGNFYGGGSLGKVDGDVISILNNCIVTGNVFGAGYSASTPTVEVMPTSGFITEPFYYEDLGSFGKGILPSKDPELPLDKQTVTYSWDQDNAISIDKTNHILYTTENLSKSNLGSVAGNVNLTIKGNSVIGTEGNPDTGNVFGGGESSYVTGTTNKITVTLKGNAQVYGNVYGGGDEGLVEGSTEVNIEE
ncbi:MAG: chitobiase/beta-hexosaminidase C-terminal domain-containing protein [Prevotella sp.]|nr:chitobiase/beta-hexosaminidase C-terminal domain-containing protein [Prevotella sp.]